MKNKIVLFLLGAVLFVSACTDRPSFVLSDKKMEDVLYDLYLADAVRMDNYQLFDKDSIRRQELLNSVYDKHGITEQSFDTTLVWYSAHLEQYVKVLEKVESRYSDLSVIMQDSINARERRLVELSRLPLIDTARFYIYTPGRLQNRFTFNYEDTAKLSSLRKLNIDFSVLGISKTVVPELHLYLYTADTVINYFDEIIIDGQFMKQYTLPDGLDVERVYGYIQLPDSIESLILFTDFSVFTQKDLEEKE